jgi:hypothetical protein
MELDCPLCHRPTDSLKQFNCLRYCVFLLAGAFWQWETVRACPGCLRRHLWKRCALNLLPANFLWPFLILPGTLLATAVSYRKGHSKEVLRLIEEAKKAPPPAALASPFAVRRTMTAGEDMSWGRVMAVLAWLLFWVPVLGLLMTGLAWLVTRRAEAWPRPASRAALIASALAHLGWVALILITEMTR